MRVALACSKMRSLGGGVMRVLLLLVRVERGVNRAVLPADLAGLVMICLGMFGSEMDERVVSECLAA